MYGGVLFGAKICLLSRITSQGSNHPVPKKVSAVGEAPTPKDVSQLRSFLGLVNSFRNFLLNLATLLHPMYTLLQSMKTCSWRESQEQAF